jgi:hypothetical protein
MGIGLRSRAVASGVLFIGILSYPAVALTYWEPAWQFAQLSGRVVRRSVCADRLQVVMNTDGLPVKSVFRSLEALSNARRDS